MDDAKFQLRRTALPPVMIVQPFKFEDERGFFVETYSRAALAGLGFNTEFVQDNHSLSKTPNTLRGLHYQLPPFAQAKLVRVVRGRIWDVAVDLRLNSPTFQQWFGLELSAANQTQLLIPPGFGHGFITLEADSEIIYKVSAGYSAQHDRGVAWDDPDLAIDWPVAGPPILSAKDSSQPPLATAEVFE